MRGQNALRHAKHRICNIKIVNTHRYSQPLSTTTNKSQTNSKFIPYTSYSQTQNWAGYVASDSHGFKEIQSYWVVPTYYGPKSPSNSRAVSWVGIGGYNDNNGNLLQAGTTEDPTDGYNFWYEEYPKGYMQIMGGIVISPGDSVYVEVDYNDTYSNTDNIYIENATTNSYTDDPVDRGWVPDESHVEWIDERSGCSLSGGKYYALSDFQSVQWSYGAAVDNANNGNLIGGFSNTNLKMVDYNNTTVLAAPGGLVSNENFTDVWKANGTSKC
ncbi:MAG TPA: G1 family glutamic endopeptidase [Ktedonobacteraceae bacterium]|jgi:hypothetical protein|nr:G1 family glutamic endopeptidase [Ktedonobacteraceae bacterium]